MTEPEYERCVAVLESVHRLHNWRHYATKAGVVRDPWNVWITFRGDLATFDGDELTRLVLAAHQHRVRASINAYGFHYMRLQLSPRAERGSLFEWHPGLGHLAERVGAAGVQEDQT